MTCRSARKQGVCLSLHLGACVCCALCGVCVHYVVWGALRLLLAIKRNDVQISQESDYRVCVCMCACICVCACVYALWCGGCRDPCLPSNVMTCRSVRKQCIGCVCVCVCVCVSAYVCGSVCMYVLSGASWPLPAIKRNDVWISQGVAGGGGNVLNHDL